MGNIVTATERGLDAAIDVRRGEIEAFLSSLVRAPSVLGSERPAQLLIARRLRSTGIRAELRDVPVERVSGLPGWAPVARSYKARPNVIATAPGSGGGRSLVLNGHVDVVSPEPVGWWTGGDPFSGRIEGGRLHGRGSWDMKGGLAAALWAWEAVRATDAPLRGEVRFESVIEEECTGNGALAARLDAPPADAAIIPECTGLETFTETPVVLWVEVTVRGRPAYVGRPGAYVNAIETAVPLIERLRAQVADGLTLSVGTIRGGDWPSTVPLECSFVCRVSAPRSSSVEQARRTLEGWIAAAAGADPWLADNPPTIGYPGFQAEGWMIHDGEPILRLLDQVHGAVAGEALRHVAFPGTADGRAFAARGEPAIYYGPTGANQHAPDEWVDLESVRLVARVLARTIVEWCG